MVKDANKQNDIDTDIQQCKADILRVRQSVGSSQPATPANLPIKDTQSKLEKTPDSPIETELKIDDIIEGKIQESDTKNVPLEEDKTDSARRQIPRFDLGKQILKEQRQAASTRRKRPQTANKINTSEPAHGTVGEIISQAKQIKADAHKTEETTEMKEKPDPSAGYTVKRLVDLDPGQQEILEDIVSRDIKKFCDNNNGNDTAQSGYGDN